MKNSELLATSRRLSGIEKQSQYVLRLHSTPMPCPNCAKLQNVFEATGVAVDDYDLNQTGEKIGKCVGCGRGLKHIVPFVCMAGPGWMWELVPVEQAA